MRDLDESRCYIDHLLAEHRRLHGMLRQMRAAILASVEPDAIPSFAELIRILHRLRDELSRHFADEEAGGCLDEAVSRCPSLSPDAERVKAEHPAILQEIDALIQLAGELSPTPANQLVIQRSFDRLYQRLVAHEKAENQILARGLGTPINGDDAGQTVLIYDR